MKTFSKTTKKYNLKIKIGNLGKVLSSQKYLTFGQNQIFWALVLCRHPYSYSTYWFYNQKFDVIGGHVRSLLENLRFQDF